MSNVLSQGTLVQLNVSIWSARARLQASDLPDNANIPPESLVTLGSKRLYRKDLLRPFGKFKARALTLLDRTGMRFLGGWLIRDDLVAGLEQELAAIASEFTTEVTQFTMTYGSEVSQWLDQYPAWRHILVNVVPDVTNIGKKFHFDWQSYKVQPATDHSKQHADTVVDAAIQDITKAASSLFEETFKDKNTVTPKAWRPVRTLIGKLDSMSYIDGRVDAIRLKLVDALARVEGSHNDAAAVSRFKAVLASMTHNDVVEAELGGAAATEGDELDALLAGAQAMLDDVKVRVDAAEQRAKEFAHVEELDSGGLW